MALLIEKALMMVLAALTSTLPACVAVIEHTPGATVVKFVPLTVHTDDGSLVNVTERPEVALTLSGMVETEKACGPGLAKVMV